MYHQNQILFFVLQVLIYVHNIVRFNVSQGFALLSPCKIFFDRRYDYNTKNKKSIGDIMEDITLTKLSKNCGG